VVALSSEPRNLSPIFLDLNAGNWKTFNGLVDLDAALNPVPDLAAELPEVSDGGQRVRVRLREGVKFHDGQPLTAEDVVFTWRSIMDEGVASPVRTVMAVDLQEVRALDPRTVEFGLSRPDPAFVEKLYTGIVPRHLLQGEDLNKTAFNRKPVGTGPYKFEEWRDGERLSFVANPDYFGPPAGIGRIVFTFVPDDNARVALLQGGAVDYARVPPTLVEGFRRDARFRVVEVPSASISQVSLPNEHPVLRDSTVRRAMALAVDRAQIVKQIYGGLGAPATGPILAGPWAHDPQGAQGGSTLDQNGARALLQSAGWRPGGDGIMTREGQRLAFTLMYLASISEDRQIALALRSDLARVGMDVAVEGVQSPGYEPRLRQDAWLHGIGLPYDPDYTLWSRYHSRFAGDPDPSTNPAAMRSPAVDAALEAGRNTLEREQRKQAYGRLQQALREDGSYLHLAQRPVAVVVSSKVSGLEPRLMGSPHGAVRGLFWGVEKWRLGARGA
jgi:peptide/nickel transport system substrate-binding protein